MRNKLTLWQALFFEDLDDDLNETGKFYADVICWQYPKLNRLVPVKIGPADSYEELRLLVIKTLYAMSPKYRLSVIDDFHTFNIYKERNQC